ncbi:MAG: hypothetical protein K6G75_10745 [Lachnospiraceae bacterium]|nr:hypothetical protein [Lachnospiraceae bacterium]
MKAEEERTPNSNSETKKDKLISNKERSLKEVLKEVLDGSDYQKVIKIAEIIDSQGSITPSEAKDVCGKSETTTWRYLSLLVNTGLIVSEGKTNNTIYKRI